MNFSFFLDILIDLKNNKIKDTQYDEEDHSFVISAYFYEDIDDECFKIKKLTNIKKLIKDNNRNVYSIICDEPFLIRLFTKLSGYPDNWIINDVTSLRPFIHIKEDGEILNSNFLEDFPNIKNIKNISEDIQFYLKLQNKI